MKLINFTKNLTKTAINGCITVLVIILTLASLMGGVYTVLAVIGYLASLCGVLIYTNDGTSQIVFTGYVICIAFGVLYFIGYGISLLVTTIKEIWKNS